MPSPSGTYDVEYWKSRAEEARMLAESMLDAHTRLLMLGIAQSYEKIAESYQKLANWKDHSREP